jgi:hypothetical protein
MNMNPIRLLTAAITLRVLAAGAQSALPYYSGFDNSQQLAFWTQVRLGASGTYSWNVFAANFYSSPSSLQHNYPVGGSVTNDWYVSPFFDLSNGGRIDSLRYMFSGFGMPNAGDTVALYLLSGSGNPSTATLVTMLKDFRGTDYQNDNVWRKLTNITIPPAAGPARIAFKYQTFQNWLDVRFDNLALSCNGPPAPVNTTPTGKLVTCANNIAMLSVSGTGTVSWYSSPTSTTPISTGHTLTTQPLSAGSHTFYAAAELCAMSASRTAITVTASACTNIGETVIEVSLVADAAAEGNFTLFSAIPVHVTVRDLAGKILFATNEPNDRVVFKTKGWSPGMYVAECRGGYKSAVKKFILE